MSYLFAEYISYLPAFVRKLFSCVGTYHGITSSWLLRRVPSDCWCLMQSPFPPPTASTSFPDCEPQTGHPRIDFIWGSFKQLSSRDRKPQSGYISSIIEHLSLHESPPPFSVRRSRIVAAYMLSDRSWRHKELYEGHRKIQAYHLVVDHLRGATVLEHGMIWIFRVFQRQSCIGEIREWSHKSNVSLWHLTNNVGFLIGKGLWWSSWIVVLGTSGDTESAGGNSWPEEPHLLTYFIRVRVFFERKRCLDSYSLIHKVFIENFSVPGRDSSRCREYCIK